MKSTGNCVAMPSDAQPLRADRNASFGVSRSASLALLALPACSPAPRAPTRSTTRWRGFSTTSFPQTEKAIGELAAEAPPQAAAILEALGDNRLLIDPADHHRRLQDRRRRHAQRQDRRDDSGRKRRRLQEGARQQCAAPRHRRRDGVADARQPRSGEASRRGGRRLQDARRQRAAGASGAARQGKRSARRRRVQACPRRHPRNERQRYGARPACRDRRH